MLAVPTIAATQHTGTASPRPRLLARAYQPRGASEDTETFSRTFKVGRGSSLFLTNVAGDLTVTGGPGDEIKIDAVKRTRAREAATKEDLARASIEASERGGRVEVRTVYSGRHNQVSVDFTVRVPSDASVDLKSVSGDIKLSNVTGEARAESVSGRVSASGVGRVASVKSVSGDVDLTDVKANGDLTANSVSGHVQAKGIKARSIDASTVSGDLLLDDMTCERVTSKSVSGSLEYSGPLARSGRYELHSHSGTIRLRLAGDTGFELEANSFSGTIRSDLPLTLHTTDSGDERRHGPHRRAIRGTFGDGSALITLQTFSGDILVSKR